MKKTVLRSLLLATAVASSFSLSALADTHSSEAGKFTPSLNVEGRYTTFDSTRKTNFDFLSQRFRLGGQYSQGAFVAVGEAEFRGNNYGETAVSSDLTAGQSVGVRQAYLDYCLFRSDDSSADFHVTAGRFIPHAAKMYGNDALTGWFTLSGFLPEDGLGLTYDGKLGSVDLNAQFAVVNSMQVFLYSPAPTTNTAALSTKTWQFNMSGAGAAFAGGTTFNANGAGAGQGTMGRSTDPSSASSNTAEKAYIANVGANMDAGAGKVEVMLAYGMQNNDISSVGTNGTLGTTASSATANDVNYGELSVGYNYQNNLKAGLWYSLANIGETRTFTESNGGASKFGADNGLKNQYSVAGIGVDGNSKLWGLTNIVSKDDMLTYGGGVEMFMHRQTGTGSYSDSDAAKNDVTMVTLGGGYAKGPWSAQLNLSYFMAENSVFLNQGNNNYNNTAFLSYISFGLSI